MPLYEGLGSLGLITEKHTTVVFDFGYAYTKLGFVGETGPRAIVRSEVLCRTTEKLINVFDYKDQDELRHHLVDFIHKLYFKHLLVNSKDRRVVVVENLLCPSIIRETIASVLFRYYEVLSLLFVPSHLVCLMTLGISTGIVLDIGYKEATLIPIYEGVPVLHAWQALPLGASAIHKCLEDALLERGSIVCSADKESKRLSSIISDLPNKTLEDIKVRCCFVSSMERSSALINNKYDRSMEPPPPPPSVEYPFGGEQVITIPGTVRELAPEILFEADEDKLSLPHMILNCVLKCSIDMRRPLAANVVVIGGCASMTGLKHRLLTVVRHLAQCQPYSDATKVTEFKCHKPPAKDNYVAWLGGAILGSTEAVSLRSVLRENYLQNNRMPDWSNLACNVREEAAKRNAA